MSNRINLVRGTSQTFPIVLVDSTGTPLSLDILEDASAEFVLRIQPTDVFNILRFTTLLNPTSLAFQLTAAVLDLSFVPSDTANLDIQTYFYQVQVTLSDGNIYDVVPWNIFDLNLGGSAATAPPVFDNTVKIDQDYPLPDDMTYRTPGGSPIENAQVRVYKKSDFDAGNLTSPVGVTTTNAGGKWVQPVLVVPGFTYVARLEKPYEFGPDVKEFIA